MTRSRWGICIGCVVTLLVLSAGVMYLLRGDSVYFIRFPWFCYGHKTMTKVTVRVEAGGMALGLASLALVATVGTLRRRFMVWGLAVSFLVGSVLLICAATRQWLTSFLSFNPWFLLWCILYLGTVAFWGCRYKRWGPFRHREVSGPLKVPKYPTFRGTFSMCQKGPSISKVLR